MYMMFMNVVFLTFQIVFDSSVVVAGSERYV